MEKIITLERERRPEQDITITTESTGYTEGYETGKQDGYTKGKQEGYNSGKEVGITEGKTAEYDRFWNGYQNNGKRKGYAYAFRGSGWTDETYKPKYKIVATGSLETAYRECKITKIENIDTSGATNFNTTFYNNQVEIYDELDFSSATNTTNAFAHSTKVHTIRKIISSETTVWHSQAFYNCANLENIIFEGVIATNLICNSSKLTIESLLSIINALKNYKAIGDTSTHTCTIGSSNLKKLTNEQKAIATDKGWTLA